jgi:hypothetical protein
VVVPCTLTCSLTRTPPNQVSYLKGSSMESFILGPTPKIDSFLHQVGAVRSFSTQRKVRTKIHVVRTDDTEDCRLSRRYVKSSRRMVHWIVWRLDGMTRRLDGWQGTRISDLYSVQNFRKALWIVESLLKNIITQRWFCPTECGQLQTNKLPIWPFCDKNYLTG